MYAHIHAQQVSRNYVLVEIATGTWCGYCPVSVLAADNLGDNGGQLALFENHQSNIIISNFEKSLYFINLQEANAKVSKIKFVKN